MRVTPAAPLKGSSAMALQHHADLRSEDGVLAGLVSSFPVVIGRGPSGHREQSRAR